MKVHILDDWFDTLRGLTCFDRLSQHDVTVWTDHEPDPARLAERVREAEALVLFRERTRIGADLLDRLPNLRLISQRSVYPHVDVAACSRNGVLLWSGPWLRRATIRDGIALLRDLPLDELDILSVEAALVVSAQLQWNVRLSLYPLVATRGEGLPQ